MYNNVLLKILFSFFNNKSGVTLHLLFCPYSSDCLFCRAASLWVLSSLFPIKKLETRDDFDYGYLIPSTTNQEIGQKRTAGGWGGEQKGWRRV